MTDQLSVEKQTLKALRALRQRVEELEGRGREPIAIVGVACRFPGGADSPEDYWDLLLQRRNAVSEIPRERMDLDALFDSRPQTPGKTYSRWAGLLEEPGQFDASAIEHPRLMRAKRFRSRFGSIEATRSSNSFDSRSLSDEAVIGSGAFSSGSPSRSLCR